MLAPIAAPVVNGFVALVTPAPELYERVAPRPHVKLHEFYFDDGSVEYAYFQVFPIGKHRCALVEHMVKTATGELAIRVLLRPEQLERMFTACYGAAEAA